VRKHWFQCQVVLHCMSNFIISTAKPLSTLNVQTPIGPQIPQQEYAKEEGENEEDEEDEDKDENEEDLQRSEWLLEFGQSAPQFLDRFPRTRACFELFTDRFSSLSLDESSSQCIQPLLSAPDGRLFISRQNEGVRTLTHIAASYRCGALYQDLTRWHFFRELPNGYGCYGSRLCPV
jgi:hypothetical protein